ncbi:MAG: methyltransferase domain-containing protein [Nitrospirales bacterium]
MKNLIKSFVKSVVPEKYHDDLEDLYLKWDFRGNRFACPFCGGHFGKMLPTGTNVAVWKEKNMVGGGYRLNARCPTRSCQSLDRERLLYLFLKEKTSIFSARVKLLHVAPERNLQKIFLNQKNIDYLSADLDAPSAMIKMDVMDIQFNDHMFDVVICNHVLEHVPDDKKAMAELHRVLKPNGWALLQVPLSLSLDATYEDATITSPEDRERMFGQKNHLRIYARDYKDRLECVGFGVKEYEAVRELGADIVQRFALPEKENIYICSKE